MGELMAVLDLLQQTAHLDEPLLVYCDSKYVIDSITKWMKNWKRKGWKKADGKPVLNVEVMKALDEAMQGREARSIQPIPMPSGCPGLMSAASPPLAR